jgi:hypothetical protein
MRPSMPEWRICGVAVGRVGLEPPISAVIGPERCASERERPSVRRDVLWPGSHAPMDWVPPKHGTGADSLGLRVPLDRNRVFPALLSRQRSQRMVRRACLGGGDRRGRTVASVMTVLAVILALQACGAPAHVGGATTPSAGEPSPTSTAAPTALLTPTPIPSNRPACPSQDRPSARSSASMAYMSELNQAVLFGGWSSSKNGFLSDTWTWNAGCWTLNPLSKSPSPREGMAMAYDAVRKVVVAFGGRTDPVVPTSSTETWVWDGHLWSETTTGPAMAQSWATFDMRFHKVLMYGWANGGVAQTWAWDGATWHQLEVANPPARSAPVMAWDPSSGHVLLFGGLDLHTMSFVNDTWAWNGSAWSKLTPLHNPSPRQRAAMASFSLRHEVILIGGNGRGGDLPTDAWIWNGSDWSETGGVGARVDATAMDIGSAVLLFGGSDLNGDRNDVELWNGTSWTTS